MELCKLEGEDEEDIVDTEEEIISEDQSLPLALTTSISETNPSLERRSNSRAHSPSMNAANDNDNLESMDKIDNELEEQSEEREEDRMVEREERDEGNSPPGLPPASYPRFPTSHLFPPLPFDNLLPLIGDEAELKVGEF